MINDKFIFREFPIIFPIFILCENGPSPKPTYFNTKSILSLLKIEISEYNNNCFSFKLFQEK